MQTIEAIHTLFCRLGNSQNYFTLTVNDMKSLVVLPLKIFISESKKRSKEKKTRRNQLRSGEDTRLCFDTLYFKDKTMIYLLKYPGVKAVIEGLILAARYQRLDTKSSLVNGSVSKCSLRDAFDETKEHFVSGYI